MMDNYRYDLRFHEVRIVDTVFYDAKQWQNAQVDGKYVVRTIFLLRSEHQIIILNGI